MTPCWRAADTACLNDGCFLSRADGNRSTSVFAASGAGASWVDYIPTTVPSWEAALTGFAAMLVLMATLIAAIVGVRWYRSRHR